MADAQGIPSPSDCPPVSSQPGSSSQSSQTVNIHIVSPTPGIPTFDLPSVPVETTVRQLKDKIQEALPSHPNHDHQRLIHRGGLLNRDDLSLGDIMTTDQLLSLEHQTIHLVVKAVADAPSLPSARTSQPLQHAPERRIPQQNTPQYYAAMATNIMTAQQAQLIQQSYTNERLQREPAPHEDLRQEPAPHEGPQQEHARQEQLARQERARQERAWQELQEYAIQEHARHQRAWYEQQELLRQEAYARQERVRQDAALFAQYTQYPGVHEPPRGTGNPQAYQGFSTPISTNLPNGPAQPTQPDTTTHFSLGPRQGDHTDTPGQSAYAGLGAPVDDNLVGREHYRQTPSNQPEVYILSSPTGPRGLLIHGNADMYVTPAAVRYRPMPHQPTMPSAMYPWHVQTPPPRQPPQQGEQLPQQVQAQLQQQALQARGRQGPRQGPVRLPVHPNNPGVAPLVAAWPHIWLLVRLSVFVWWFSYNDPTWARWLTLTAIAGVVFLLNTGLLTGFANEAWEPFRHHLEGLIPLADPNRPQPEAARAAPPVAAGRDTTGAPGQATDPDPGQMAARLVAERRVANGNWLLDHVRRLERAGLLFLASIAPGVAEGHIAHLEAQERAARQQREEAAAAAAAAAAAEAEAEAADQNHEAPPAESAHEEEQFLGEEQVAVEQRPLLMGEA